VAFAHLAAAAALGIRLRHFVVTTAGSAALFAATGALFAAVSLGGLALTTTGGSIFAAGCAVFAAIALRHLVLAAAVCAVFTTGSPVFAAGRSRFRVGGLISRSRDSVLRPHTNGKQ